MAKHISPRIKRSMELFEHAKQIMPAGTQLISRRPTRFAYGITPVYAERAKGSHIWDVDGEEYIDWGSSCGAIILGYANPVVDEAVREQIAKGSIYTINHPLEIEVAEELIRTVPCAEMVRYTKGGGEACALAVRIARGATGKDKILFCGYHGWLDWYQAANLSAGTLDQHLFPGIDPIGVPKALKGTIEPFKYGDQDDLDARLKAHDGELAAIIMEPIRSEVPPEGYLEGVRELATRYGVVLIFDEVSTGLRPAVGGAQEMLGVTPDLSAFAKSISNGYAMGAVVGKREVMEPASRMFVSSSYWSDCVGLAACRATLAEVRRRRGPERLRELGALLQSRMNDAISDVGLSATCGGFLHHPATTFHIDDTALQKKVVTLYIQEMSKRNHIGYASYYLNLSHTEEDIDSLVAASHEAFTVIKGGLDTGTIDDLLECEPQEDLFRRLVR